MTDYTVWLITIVYPMLAVFFFLRGVIRILRYRRVHQDKTLLTGAFLNFSEFVTLSIASSITGIAPAASPAAWLPVLRFCWAVVLVAAIVSTLQEWRMWREVEKMRKMIALDAEKINSEIT